MYKEPLTKNSKLLSRDERVKIFSIVDTLYTVHSNFLQKLQKVILDQTPSGIIALGEVFKDELVQELKVLVVFLLSLLSFTDPNDSRSTVCILTTTMRVVILSLRP